MNERQSNDPTHEISLVPATSSVIVEGATIALGRVEFGVFSFLVRHAGTTFSRQEIIAGVRGGDYPVTDRSVDVQIAGLRKKLGPLGARIETVRGKGYRFVSASTV